MRLLSKLIGALLMLALAASLLAIMVGLLLSDLHAIVIGFGVGLCGAGLLTLALYLIEGDR